ncbi:Luciferase-like monooxygenase [Streptoalloteichus tenebrarius]|uniref:Luciferase-like monooxygenase n=1 Tax=Streptoalloteichus tenebrarius (strain ATCC 17920 / DSM 40477 / JCM 4838 / CBS 697.72 / NBRC 16177 / NCIMB 11028 / NRRL B-12390 / A12253. 1 / ISP 5477) TaxID=1933 RepID=A0ABT1I3Z9_STRSD|nr:LLM class flavin-dependent oxidoreductase [Streptoalloteichus tenebrarius]MCP2262295.1 Luciferase-like monooxygenase [Streptoalloteichus tenebrarius]BFF01813.1 LLM class flavin-dependent oxidoreductase [Streptoalloteichus tenebrarius]
MRFGIVILPEYRWSEAAPRWRGAEEFGFDHAWTYDHLAWRSLADGPWFGTVATLTAAATVTSRIRLGTLVASPNFRHPVAFARELMALDDVSGGRFTLGVGAGGTGHDATVLGGEVLPPARRMARLTEFVELLDRLLTTDHVDHAGEFFTAADARTVPGCAQRPRLPFVIAANGPRAMRLAARWGAGWVTTGPATDDLDAWWRGVAEMSAGMDKALADEGRDPVELDRLLSLDSAPVFSLSSVDTFVDAVGRAAELGFTDVVTHWPRSGGEYYVGEESVLETVAADVLPTLR